MSTVRDITAAKQRNYLAKYNELWVQIEMLVNEGNAKEAQIQTLSTIDEVTSFVI